MGWFKKKSDPISDRASALSSEIASLEAQIKRLDEKLHHAPGQPRLRSTARPHGATISHNPSSPAPPPLPATPDPVFEEINQERLTPRTDLETTTAHYNELGVRKYDFPALLTRIRHFFRGPSTSNPKLVSYLAAGGVQGLRPLRKEKRVARNRFIAFAIFLLVILIGLLSMIINR